MKKRKTSKKLFIFLTICFIFLVICSSAFLFFKNYPLKYPEYIIEVNQSFYESALEKCAWCLFNGDESQIPAYRPNSIFNTSKIYLHCAGRSDWEWKTLGDLDYICHLGYGPCGFISKTKYYTFTKTRFLRIKDNYIQIFKVDEECIDNLHL